MKNIFTMKIDTKPNQTKPNQTKMSDTRGLATDVMAFCRYSDLTLSRFIGIFRTEQNGKTFEAIRIMCESIMNDFVQTSDSKYVNTVNTFFCSNSVAITDQTGNRIKKTDYIENNDIKVQSFSSAKTSDIRTSSDVEKEVYKEFLLNPGVSKTVTLAMCTNKKRISDIQRIIETLNSSPATTIGYHFNVFIDECDKDISAVLNFADFIEANPDVSITVYILTATSKKVFENMYKIRVYGYDVDESITNYYGAEDIEKNATYIKSRNTKNVPFVKDTLDTVLKSENPDSFINESKLSNTNWYIPAEFKKNDHNEMKDLLLEYGFNVLVMNGDHFLLYSYQGDKLKDFKGLKDENQNAKLITNTLVGLRKECPEMGDKPLAITGHICIGRGVTFMTVTEDPETSFIFNYGIMTPNPSVSPDDFSQQLGRMKCNQKTNLLNQGGIKVFTTEQVMTKAVKTERLTRAVAEYAQQNKDSSGTVMICMDVVEELDQNINDKCFTNKYEYYENSYSSYNEYKNGCKEVEKLFNEKGITLSIRGVQNPADFELSNTTKFTEHGFYIHKSLPTKKNEKRPRFMSDIKTIQKSTSNFPVNPDNLELGNGTVRSYVYYDDGEIDPTNYKFYIRAIARKE